MDAETRGAFLLRHGLDLSARETSSMLGISQRTVSRRCRTAMDVIGRELNTREFGVSGYVPELAFHVVAEIRRSALLAGSPSPPTSSESPVPKL